MIFFDKSKYEKTTIRRSYGNYDELFKLVQSLPDVIIKYHIFSDKIDIYFPKKSRSTQLKNSQSYVITPYEISGIIFK